MRKSDCRPADVNSSPSLDQIKELLEESEERVQQFFREHDADYRVALRPTGKKKRESPGSREKSAPARK